MPSIDVLIRKVDQLPSIPAVIKRLVDLTADPESAIADILELIEKDQALTAGILKLSNSSYYGLSQQVSSIKEAVVMLGFTTVSNMCITLGPSLYFRRDVWIYGQTGSDLWRHAIGTAICCEQLARRHCEELVELAYTAGLLHDIGKLVLAEYHEDDLKRVKELEKNGKSLARAEHEILGTSHAAVGGKLARRWKFPAQLVKAIKYHHEPSRARGESTLCELVYMAEILAGQCDGTEGPEGFSPEADKVFQKYQLDRDAVDELIVVARAQIEETEASLQSLSVEA